jgi:shikimate dehydrogenase
MRQVLELGGRSLEFEGGRETRVFLLLGSPVAHSLSPRMHEAALRAAGIDAVYRALEVPALELEGVLRDLRTRAGEGRVAGANVTVPHKRAVLPALDVLEREAELAGAVNTIVPRRGGGGLELHGANTDVGGLVQALADLGTGLAGRRLLVLGAGGLARAAVAAALQAGATEIRVCGRDLERAREMLDAVAAGWRGRIPLLACASMEDAAGCVAGADVLVQATPLGRAAEDPPPVRLESAPAELVVLDAVYTPGGTALVRSARARGLRAGDGHALLAYQGAAAFAAWTGLPPPVETMRRALGV